MSGTYAMEAPTGPRGAKLVAVDGRTFPLEAVRVAASTSGGIACSTLVQTYRNPYAEPLEVVYTMRLVGPCLRRSPPRFRCPGRNP